MIAAALLLLAVVADQTSAAPALRADLVHADLPLFGDDYADKWPQSFTKSGTGDFGCTSRVGFGDWRFTETGEDEPSWYRFSNYGVLHCWANVGEASERDKLEEASSRPAFFVLLGREGNRELWALQLGARPGSEYILLARLDRGQDLVTSFTVLQRACPRDHVRRGRSVDILSTSYCDVRMPGELRALAHRMAMLPPLGRLEHASAPAPTP